MMINQLEIPMYLEEALPAISKELTVSKNSSAYDAMHTLIDFTCRNIKAHNFNIVKRCFQIADKLYSKGNNAVKNAVQNVFVFSFTKIFQTYSAEKQDLLAIIPMTLYSLYLAQVHHRGC